LNHSSKDEIEEVNNKIKKNEMIRSSIESEVAQTAMQDKEKKSKGTNIVRKSGQVEKKNKKGSTEAKSLIA